MAEFTNKSFSRKNSASKKGSNNAYVNDTNSKSSKDLLSREEEYKRLNEELEAKTANLIRDAEQVFAEQESVLSKPSLLDNINTDDFLEDWERDDDMEGNDSRPTTASRPSSTQIPSSSRTSKTRPPSQTKKSSAKSRPRSRKAGGKADDVAVPDEAFMTDFRDFSLQNTITNIEGRLDKGELGQDDSDDDVMPSAAAEMGSEAQIRFLKAKLRVMQEELDRLAHECSKKEEENHSLTTKIKSLEEERNRISRTSSGQQQQIDKYKRMADDAKSKAESAENQLTATKKELDGIRRSQKQQTSNQGVTEVRLNRALEEVEKFKAELNKQKTSSKDSGDQGKRRMEQLITENKRLEKQKNELMTGFKKQLKLIDILKKQKMHIEAAKMLQFTEEEFVKALEWGGT